MYAGRSTEHNRSSSLDELSLPAGTGFNREEAWEKLHARLNAPESKPSFLRTWWSIAAMLTLVIGLYLILSARERSGQSFAFTPSFFIPEMKGPDPSVALQNNSTAADDKKTGTPTAIKVLNSYVSPDTAVIASHQFVEIPVHAAKDTATGISPYGVHTAAAPAKKKLRVVYFNEIARGDTPDEVSGSGTGVSLTIPGIKKDNTTAVQKADAPDLLPDFPRNRWLPFNKTAKPKE